MAQPIQFHSQVGDDGVLNVQVNLGPMEARREVVVTIEPVGRAEADAESLGWHEFLDRTYGSCAGLGLERPEQGVFEQREPLL